MKFTYTICNVFPDDIYVLATIDIYADSREQADIKAQAIFPLLRVDNEYSRIIVPY